MAPRFAPLLAIGTSGGNIYVVDPLTAKVLVALVGAHKGAVTALQVLGSEAANGADRLISAGADGTVAVWEPSTAAYGPGPRREISPRLFFKAHEAAVSSLCLVEVFPGEGSSRVQYLATTGEDKRVALWQTTGSWTLHKSVQPLHKTTFHSAVHCPWASAGLGGSPSLVLASGESTVLMGLHPESGASSHCLDLAGWLDPGQKKAVKVYGAFGHPLRPHLLAVATNTGLALLGFSGSGPPAVLALPHQVLTLDAIASMPEAAPNAPSAVRAAQGFTCLAAAGQSLWTSSLRLETTAGPPGSSEKSVRLDQGPREAIAKLEHSGPVLLACSASGRSVSVVWPQRQLYCVFCLAPSGVWEVIDSGAASALVWNSLQSQYALLCSPPVVVDAPKPKKGMFAAFGRRKHSTSAPKPEESAESAPAHGARPGSHVQVHVVDESRAAQWVVNQGVSLDGLPSALHGGPMLGVVVEGRASGGEGLNAGLQLLSWTNFTAVGPRLPEPRWLSWEPDCTVLALAYQDSVELCRTNPRFEAYASLPIPEACSGIWQTRQLFLATPTAILAVFTDPAQEFVQTIPLASYEGVAASQVAPSTDSSPLPITVPRPLGPVVLMGIRHSYLWLADGLGRPYLVSLRHAGVRLRCLAARSELSTARTIAERGLGAIFHDDIARYLVAMGGQEGVVEALRLTGLSPQVETALAVRVEDWDRAAAAFQTLALGIKDRSLLQVVTDSGGSLLESSAALDAHADQGSLGVDAVSRILEEEAAEREAASKSFNKRKKDRQGGSEEDDEEGSADNSAAEGGEAEEEEVKPSDIDWDAELADTSNNDPFRGEAEGARPLAPPTVYATASGKALQSILTQGLDLADAAMAAGHWDAARMVLGVFVRMASALPRTFLASLVVGLGQCAMTESAHTLARAAVVGASPNLHVSSVAAPLAALIGGRNSRAVAATLTKAELAPLASVFANVWGVQGEDPPAEAWERMLDADDPHRGQRFVVVPPVL
ncbi:hypothetical protein ACKKBF_B35090 [Auxenochlorella protothecoides x Auxenochlorella symbiontica]